MAQAGDVNQKLYNKLAAATMYGPIGANADLTTRLARWLSQDRQTATSNATLWDGKDEVPALRTQLDGLADF